ncbi:MAG: hypothetical protein M0C28_44480 [Candidatus Moduliflexus flocculans]|nr:hypothetical protein [Candidatus Moduliflexus flocculans]
MADEKERRHPEINFLPPLDMVLTFFDRTFRNSATRRRNCRKNKKRRTKRTSRN